MSLDQLHWFGWLLLVVGTAAMVHDMFEAWRYVRRGDVDLPMFVLPVGALTIVLYMVLQ